MPKASKDLHANVLNLQYSYCIVTSLKNQDTTNKNQLFLSCTLNDNHDVSFYVNLMYSIKLIVLIGHNTQAIH